MNADEIAFAIGITIRLVKEYEQIIDEYNRKGYKLDKSLEHEPHIENIIDKWILENTIK